MPSVTERLLITYSILLQRLFLCYSSCVKTTVGFFYTAGLNIFFLSELNIEYFTKEIF